MSKAKQRNDWLRFGALIATVENKTNFSGGKVPALDALDCMPQWLVTAQDRVLAAKSKAGGKAPISAVEIGVMMGAKLPQKSFDELYPETEG